MFDCVCHCLVKQFAMCLGDVAVLSLNVMMLFVAGGGALLQRPWMILLHGMCLWSHCASKCSFLIFYLCFCMSEVLSSWSSLRAGSHVFTLFMLFICLSFGTQWIRTLPSTSETNSSCWVWDVVHNSSCRLMWHRYHSFIKVSIHQIYICNTICGT